MAGHRLGMLDLDLARDGKRLFSAGKDKIIRIWDLSTHTLLGEMTGHHDVVARLSVSPDGSHLASVADDAFRLWNLHRRRSAAGFPEGPAAESVAYSPDGRFVATGDKEGVLRIYPLKPADLLLALERRLTFPMRAEECEAYGAHGCESETTRRGLRDAAEDALSKGERARGLALLEQAAALPSGERFDPTAAAARFEAAGLLARARALEEERTGQALNAWQEAAEDDKAATIERAAELAKGDLPMVNELLTAARKADRDTFVEDDLGGAIVGGASLSLARTLAENGESSSLEPLVRLADEEGLGEGSSPSAVAGEIFVVSQIKLAVTALQDGDPAAAMLPLLGLFPRYGQLGYLQSIFLGMMVRTWEAAGQGQGAKDVKDIAEFVWNAAQHKKDPDMLATFARMLSRYDDSQAAIRFASAALKMDPDHDMARIAMGEALARKGRFSQALDQLNLVPVSSELRSEAAGLAGPIYFEDLNDPVHGYRLMEEAVDLRAGDRDFTANFAEACLGTGRLMCAEDVSRRILETASPVDDPSVLAAMRFVRIASAVLEGKIEVAERELDQLLKLRVSRRVWSYKGIRFSLSRREMEPHARRFLDALLAYVECRASPSAGRHLPAQLRALPHTQPLGT